MEVNQENNKHRFHNFLIRVGERGQSNGMKDCKYTCRLSSKYFVLCSGLLALIMLLYITNYTIKQNKKMYLKFYRNNIRVTAKTKGIPGWSSVNDIMKEFFTEG